MDETSDQNEALRQIDRFLSENIDPATAVDLLLKSTAAIELSLCAVVADVAGNVIESDLEARLLLERLGWPAQMIDRWFSRSYVRQNPIYLRCRFENGVFHVQHEKMWRNQEPLTPAQKQMRSDLEEFGLFGSVVAPVHLALGRTAAVVWATQVPRDLDRIVKSHASLLRSIAYRVLEILVPEPPLYPRARDLPYLTDRQIDCLSWLARGKTIAETAQILDLSVHTIREHLREITNRLNANNTTHAVAIACELGIVKPLLKDAP